MRHLLPLFLWLTLSVTTLFAADGELSVTVFHAGKPVAGAEVTIDGTKQHTTDNDGSLFISISEGDHRVEVVVKEAEKPLAYAKKQVSVAANKNTQMIVSLQSTGDTAVDVEAPSDAGMAAAASEESNVTRENGSLSVQIVSAEDGKPVSGARIFVKGTRIDAKSDTQGRFELELPEGEQTLSIIHSDYSSQTMAVTVVAKELVSKVYELTPASLELEEFVVLAPHVEGSIASVINEEKQSNAITSILGAEEMSKKGDSDAAGALKRVTGVTLVGGKSIFVRGLGERYSNVELNSMPLPSPDPTKRVVPLDIFPASVIGSLKVQKSATADIPSSFGGGYIDIRTKDRSDDDYIEVKVALKGNSNTFGDSHTYQGSSTDWLGFDDGYRALPSDLLDATGVKVGEKVNGVTTRFFTQEQITAFTRDYVSRDFNIQDQKLPLGYNFGLSGAKSFEIDNDQKISLSGGYEYKQEHKYREEKYYSYDMREEGYLYENPTQYGDKYLTTDGYEHGLIFNVGYTLGEMLSLKYTKLFTLNSEKTTRIVDGILGSNDEHMLYNYLDWEERMLNVDQLNGEYNYALMGEDAKLSFGAQMAQASLNQPNNYFYAYLETEDGFALNNYITNHIANKLTSDDTLTSFYLKNRQIVPVLSEEDYIEGGIALSSKERISRQNKFFLRDYRAPNDMTGDIDSIYDTYIRPGLSYSEHIFLVSQLFQAADYFDAQVDESVAYLNSFVKPTGNIEVMAGLRYVNFEQTVWQFKEDRNNPDMALRRLIIKVPESLALDGIYPSMSVKYKADENNHIDFAASKTYIVPDLREFTNGEYFHPYDVATVRGNPELENTDILSLDLKYSHYFSTTEMVKAGLFYKYLDKPIEDVQENSSSLPIYTFDNADNAVLYGFELDGRKNFGFIDEAYEGYYVSGNFSYTDSEVTLRKEQEATYSTNHRQLQGLSQVVVNATVGYDNEGRSLALSYNQMGERIRKVGLIDDEDRYPDYYEIPPLLVDFVWIEKFDKGLSAKLKLQNLLDSETVWKQGPRTTNTYRTGRKYEISLSYKY